MKNNIKIFATAALFLLIGCFGAFSVNAQSKTTSVHTDPDGITYYENILANNGAVCIKTAGTHVESLVGDGTSLSGQQYGNMENSTPNFIGYKVYVLDAEGNGTDITDELSIEYGLPLYTEKGTYSFGTGKSRFDRTVLHVAEFRPASLPQAYYGKTIKVQLQFGGVTKATLNNVKIVENFYMDVVDAPQLLYNGASTGETEFPYDGGTEYQGFVCKGEQIFFKLDNSDYPLGEEASYLGNKYKADYAWDLNTADINDNKIPAESMVSFKTNSKRILSTDLSKAEDSRIYHFMPSVQFKLNGTNVCQNRKPLIPIFSVYYTTPLEAMIEVANATSGSAYSHVNPDSDLDIEPAITVCDGDEVNVRYSYLLDGEPHDYFEATLYEIDKDGNVLSTVATYKYTDDESISDVFTIPALSAATKNKLYYYSIVVYDINFEDYNGGHNCQGEQVDFSVKVLEKGAVAKLESTGEHCEGDNVEIKMTLVNPKGNPADYTYQLKRKKKGKADDTAVDIPTNDGGNKTSFTVVDNNVPDGDFTYMMYIKNLGSCEYKAGEVNVSIAAAPVLSVNDISICKGDDAELVLMITNTDKQPDASTYTYTWTAGMTGTDANKPANFTKTVSPKPLTTTSYTVYATNDKSHCPSVPQTATVTVSLPPDIESISGVDEACLNSEVTLSPVLSSSYTPVANPISYTWTRKNGATTVEVKDGDTYTYTLDKEYVVSVSATDGNGCTSLVTKDKTVTINPLPDFAPSAAETCSGSNWTIKMNKADARSLTYSFTSSTPGAPAITTTASDEFTLASPSDITSKTTYVYTVKGTDGLGCEDTKELKLVVNPLPVVSKLTASKTSQCLGTPVTLTATANSRVTPATLTYAWYDGGTLLTGTNSTIEVNPASAGTHSYSVKVTDVNGCVESESIDVTFYEITTVSIDADKTEICKNDPVELTAVLGPGAAPADYDFLWSDGATTQVNNVTPSTTTTYSVTITQKATGCMVVSADKVITVNQLPVFTMALDDDQVCSGVVEEITLTMKPTAASATVGAVDHYEFVSGGSASDFVQQSATVYKATKAWTANTTYVYKAVTASGCESTPQSVTINVNAIPAKPIASVSPTQICKGADDQITLSVTNVEAGVEYYWFEDAGCTKPLNNGKAADSFNLPKATTAALAGNTVYYVKSVNKTSKCENSEVGQVTLIINAIPAATLDVTNPEFCIGTGSATIKATMGDAATYSYEWKSLPAGFTATTKDITVTPDVTTTYTLVATNTATGCKTDEASETITVNQKPTFTIAFDKDVCAKEEATVEMSMSTTDNIASYSYVSGGTEFTQTSLGKYSATSTWNSSTTYSYTGTSDKGCISLPVSGTLKVNDHPTAPAFTMTPAAICVDDAAPSVKLEVTAPVATSKYEWYQGTTYLGEGTTYTITTNPGANTEYSVREISESACTGDFAKKTLVVNELPIVFITGDYTSCIGNPITLTANPIAVGGGTFADDAYTWFADGVLIAGENSKNLTLIPTKNTNYSVQAVESTGCGSYISDVDVKVFNRPDFTITLDPSFVCEGIETTVTMTMTKTGDSPDIKSYTLAEGPADFAQESLGVYKATKAWTANTLYAFTAEADNGCVSVASVPVTLEVNAKPETPVLVFDNPTVCEGTTDPVEVTIKNFKTGMKYTVKDAASNIIVENHTSSKFNITSVPTVATTYYITGVAGDNCFTDEGAYTLDVAKKPTATITGDLNICEGQSTTLEANVTAGVAGSDFTYEWRVVGETKVRGNNSKITIAPEETTTYELTVIETATTSCNIVELVTVTVEKKPLIKVTADNTDFCADVDQTVILSVATEAGSAPVASYEWFNANDESKGFGPTLTLTDVWSEGHYKFYAVATSAETNACKSLQSEVTINVNPIPTKPVIETDKSSICKYATGSEDVVATVKNVEAGYKYTWYDAADNVIGDGENITIPVKNDGADQSYYVIATDENFITNCVSPKTNFTIKVVELPGAPIISGEKVYCLNDASHATVLKVDNEDPSLIYKWYVADAEVGEGVTFTTPAHIDATTEFYAVAYNATGCASEKSNIQTISIVNNPVLASADAAEILVCPGLPSTRTVEVSSATGEKILFRWTLDGVVVAETTEEATSSSYTFVSDQQTGTFNLTVEGWTKYMSCPAEPLNFKLSIKDFDDLQFTVNGDAYTEGKVYDLCQGSVANIVFSNLGGVSYKILDKDNNEVVNTSEASIAMLVIDDNDYTIIKYTGDCVSPIEQHFSFAVKNQVLFDIDAPLSACLGTALTLEAVNVDFQGNDETKVEYQWFLNGTAIAGANGPKYSIDEVKATDGGTYALTTTTEYGCTTTHEVTLDVHTIPAIEWDEDVTTSILCLDGGERYLAIKAVDGNEAALANTLWDINTLYFGQVNTNDKITVNAASPTQYNGQILTVRAYAVDANGCQSVGIERDLTVVAAPVITSVTDAEGHIDEFHLCAGNDLTLTVNSTPEAGDYVYYYTKDGVDINWNSPVMVFKSITADMAGTYTVEILDKASSCTSNIYTFTIDFPVPTATLTITPESKLVISGSEVKATVTAGYDHYTFFVNGVEQSEGVFGNELLFYPTETCTVSVNVYNEHGCYITVQDEIEVLEGIIKKTVLATPESYCSNQRETGSVISIEDPQEGVTYTLTRIDNGEQVGESIKTVAGQPVEWKTIQTTEETTPDKVEISNTFEVTASHDELPGVVETMANKVIVTEVYGYTPEVVNPSGKAENCGGTFKIENAVIGFKYVIYHNGSVFGEVEKAESKTIDFTQLIQFTGKYEVKRYYSRNNVCGEYTLATYEIAEPDLTKVIISADDKDYGYYCKQDGKTGVELSIQATTADQEYTLLYQKTLADVAEPVTVLADGATELKIVGNGQDLIIGNTADIKGDGFYSLGYKQKDCIQLTSQNIMEVIGYSAPAKEDFVVTPPSDVTTYFCEGTTFPVSVADKNGNKFAKYLEFHLVQEKPVYDDSFPILEGIDADTEAFQVEKGGTYHIEVVNTNLQKLGLYCANTVLDKFTLVRLDTPTAIKAEFENDNFCLEPDGTAKDKLTLRLLSPDVYYTVYDNKTGEIAKDEAGNELVFTDAHGTGTLSFIMPLTAGKNTFVVKAQRKAGAVECETIQVASAEVTVRPRPVLTGEVVTWNKDRKDAGVECAGVDIVVKNTTAGMLYTLYVDGDNEPFIDGGLEDNAPKSSVVSDGNDITFYNIGINAKFIVTINYPDGVLACEEKVGDVDVVANDINYVQPSLTNPNVCQGESFTQVQIKGVTEADLANYVYKVVSIKTGSDGKPVEKLNSTTLNSSDYTIDGGYLVFSKRYTSNVKLDIKVSKKVTTDPDNITESCPVQLGHIEFKVNKLPKSFELTGRNIYCGGKSDIQLILPTSETGVEYVLYVYDGEDLVEYEYEDADHNTHRVAVDGEDGMSVEFPKFSSTDPRFLDKGKYTVIAINKTTGCTSAMMNEVEVISQPSIDIKDVVDDVYESCSSDATFVEIKAANTQKDVTYYFYHTDDAAEVHRLQSGITEDMLAEIVEDQEKADDLIIRKFTGKDITCLPRISGNYVVLASYDMYACPVFLDQFSYTSYRLDKYVFNASAQCGSDIKYTLGGTQEDATYEILSSTGEVLHTFQGTGSEYSITLPNTITDSNVFVYVKASVGTCKDEMAGQFYPATLVMKEPTGEFEFYIEGSKWDRTIKTQPEICSSSNVTLLAKVDDEIGITKYSYNFYKLVEVTDTVTNATSIDTVYYTRSEVGTNVLVQNFESFDQSQTYRVILNVSSNDCGPFLIDHFDFKIKGSSSLSSRFLPDNDHIKNSPADTVSCQVSGHIELMHGEYCADETGVGLFFLNAEPGNIYRLFQRVSERVDSVTVRESVEMLDMQEVPDYSSFITGYTPQPVDTLWFTGWGSNGVGNAYGATGSKDGVKYFVSVEEKDGCVTNTSDLIIYENELPIDTVTSSPTYNEVFYALMDKDGLPNFDVKSSEYGIVDAGFVVLSHPKAGVSYDLIHVDSQLGPNTLVSHIVCDERTQERGWVDFGIVNSDEDAIIKGWGSGIYEVIATSNVTGCSVSVGSVEFIDEELVAYNVYLYMNKKQNTVSQLLYPTKDNFGNHRYIDWSRKVDIVWAPDLQTDTLTGVQYIQPHEDDQYGLREGYSIFEKKANIHFEMVQSMKDTVMIRDVELTELEYNEYVEKDPKNTFKQIQSRLEKYFLYNQYRDTVTNEVIRDSVSTGDIYISYENGKEVSRKYINTADENTKPTNDLGAIIETYKYWRQAYDTIQVVDYSRKFGDYGFDSDYDPIETPELDLESKSGLFRYTKMPSFFGKVELTYRIYNDLLPTIRFSNNAQIVILCGNNNLPGTDAQFLVPNAFSPNGDGLNDEFEILMPHGYENSQVILEVFNRWGTRVYKSSGIRYGVDCPYWDGTSTSSNMVTVGEKLPSGTYYYVLTVKVNNPSKGTTQDLDLKGFIELRR